MAEKYGQILLEAFERERPAYEAFTRNLEDLIVRLITDEGIEYVAAESRTKSIESLSEKIERPEKAQKYESIDQITDLSGVRVVAYVREDCEKICNILKKSFIVDIDNSTNKEDLMDPDRFGYLSVHYVLSYSKERLRLPEFSRFIGMKAEIQVRTILQHTWAAIDWKLRYKSDEEVPRALKRRLYRISALLEAADEDFSHIGREVDNIRQSYEESLEKGDYSVRIDKESLEIFLRQNKIVRDIEKIALKSGFSLSPPHPGSRNPLLSLLLTMQAAKINYFDQLENILKDKIKIEERLKLIFDLWHGPTMPGKLVLEVSGILRLIIIMSLERNYARDVVEEFPFGPTLQNAILAALD